MELRERFERFQGSIFSFKQRPWTGLLLARKAIDLGLQDELIEWVKKPEENGIFLNEVIVTYLMENLSDPAKIKLAVISGLKGKLSGFFWNKNILSELIDCPKVSHKILGHILNDLENALSLFDEKTIILAVQSLSLGSENLNRIAKSAVQKLAEEGELSRSERHLYIPHFDKRYLFIYATSE